MRAGSMRFQIVDFRLLICELVSNRTSVTDPQNLSTAYTYDVLNRLHTLAFNGQNPTFVFGYDALSRRNSLTRPNGVNTTYTYDPASSLLSVLHKLGTTTIDGASYTYDNAENRKTRTDKRLNTTLTYGYDNIYQLQTAKQGSTTKESYTYDIVGNRLSSLGVTPYQYNSSNELMSTPSTSYTYDNNGSVLTKSDGTQYTWDYENELTQVALPGTSGTVNFKYDPFGRRIQKSFTQSGTTTTTDYLYDGANRIEDVDTNGNLLARYVQNMGIDEPLEEIASGTTSYYQQDGLGSVSSLSNSAGALANTYTYDSYGKLTASTGTLTNPFQYAGRELDSETGLYYNRARYYDQSVGRFVSEDPTLFRGGIDFYAYVGNNPTNRTDPDGMGDAPKSCAKALADLAKAQVKASERWAAFVAYGDKEPQHAKQLAIALKRLNDAIDAVKKYCNCDLLKAEAAAALAVAVALYQEIADTIRQFCSQEPCFVP
jgi:RHS repeat-associated protein